MSKELDLDFDDKIGDDFGLGSDDMFDDFDFENLDGGADPKKGDRNPIARAFSGFKSGFTSEFQKPEMIEKAVEGALPPSFESYVTNVKAFNKNLDKTIKKSVTKHGGALKKTLKEAGYEGLADKFVENNTEEAEEREAIPKTPEQERRELLNSIFKANAEVSSSRIEVEQAREGIAEIKDNKRHQHTSLLQTQALSELKNLVSFNQNITFKYQRANLETNLKSYSVQRNTLKIVKEYSEANLAALKSIVLNTSLPEANKIRASEKLRHSVSSQWTDAAAAGFTDEGGFAKMIGKMTSDKMSGTVDKLFGWKSKYDQMNSTGESKLKMVSEVAGGIAAESLAGSASKLVANSKILDNDRVDNFIGAADMHLDTLKNDVVRHAVASTAANVADNGFMALAKSLGRLVIPEGSIGEGIGSISIKPNQYLQKHQQAQVEVIPTLLAKILVETIANRTGRKPKELVYDYTTLRFKKKSNAIVDPMSRINKQFHRDDNQQKARIAADEILGDRGTGAERKALASSMIKTSVRARAGGKNTTSLADYLESKSFTDLPSAMQRKLKRRLKDKELGMYRSLRSLKSTTATPKAMLERLIKEHGHAPLLDAGILKKSPTGEEIVVDEGKYMKWLSDDQGDFANGVGGFTSERELRSSGRLGAGEDYQELLNSETSSRANGGNPEGNIRHARTHRATAELRAVARTARRNGVDRETAIRDHVNRSRYETYDALAGVQSGVSEAIGRSLHDMESAKGPTAIRRLARRFNLKLPGVVNTQINKLKNKKGDKDEDGSSPDKDAHINSVMKLFSKISRNKTLPDFGKVAGESSRKLEEMAQDQVSDVSNFLADGMGLEGSGDTTKVWGGNVRQRLHNGRGTIRTGLAASGERIRALTHDPMSAFTKLLSKSTGSRLVLNLPTVLGNTTSASVALASATGKAENLNYIFNTPSLVIDRVLQGVNSDEQQSAQEKLIEEERKARLKLAKEQATREKREVWLRRLKGTIAAYKYIADGHRDRGITRKINRMMGRLRIPRKDMVDNTDSIADKLAAAQLGVLAAQYRLQQQQAKSMGKHHRGWREANHRGRKMDWVATQTSRVLKVVALYGLGKAASLYQDWQDYKETEANRKLFKDHKPEAEVDNLPFFNGDIMRESSNLFVKPVKRATVSTMGFFGKAGMNIKRLYTERIPNMFASEDEMKVLRKRWAEEDKTHDGISAGLSYPREELVVERQRRREKQLEKLKEIGELATFSIGRRKVFSDQLRDLTSTEGGKSLGSAKQIKIISKLKGITNTRLQMYKSSFIQDEGNTPSKYFEKLKYNSTVVEMFNEYYQAMEDPQKAQQLIKAEANARDYIEKQTKILWPQNVAAATVRYRQYGLSSPSHWSKMFRFENYIMRSQVMMFTPAGWVIDVRRLNPGLILSTFGVRDKKSVLDIAMWMDNMFLPILKITLDTMLELDSKAKKLHHYSSLTGWKQRQFLENIVGGDIFFDPSLRNPFTGKVLDVVVTRNSVSWVAAMAAAKVKSLYERDHKDPLIQGAEKQFQEATKKVRQKIKEGGRALERASEVVHKSVKVISEIKTDAVAARDRISKMSVTTYNKVKNSEFPTQQEIKNSLLTAKRVTINKLNKAASFTRDLSSKVYNVALKGTNITHRDIQSIYHTLSPETRAQIKRIGLSGKRNYNKLSADAIAELKQAKEYMVVKIDETVQNVSRLIGAEFEKLSPATRDEILRYYNKGDVEFTRLSSRARLELNRLKEAGGKAMSRASQLILENTADIRRRIGNNYAELSVAAKLNIKELTAKGKLSWAALDKNVRNEITLRYNQSVGLINKGIVAFNDLMSQLGENYDKLSNKAKEEIRHANRNGKINYDALTGATRSEIRRLILLSKKTLEKTVARTTSFINNNNLNWKNFKKISSEEFSKLSKQGKKSYKEAEKVYNMSPDAREIYAREAFDASLHVIRGVGKDVYKESVAVANLTKLHAKKAGLELKKATKDIIDKVKVLYHESAVELSKHISKYNLKLSKQTREEVKALITTGTLHYHALSKSAQNELDNIYKFGKNLFDAGIFRVGKLVVRVEQLSDTTRNELLDMFDAADLRYEKLSLRAKLELARVYDQGKTKATGDMSPNELSVVIIRKLKVAMESAPAMFQSIAEKLKDRKALELSARQALGVVTDKIDDGLEKAKKKLLKAKAKIDENMVDSEWANMTLAQRREILDHRKRNIQLAKDEYTQARNLVIDNKKKATARYLEAKKKAQTLVDSPLNKQIALDEAEDIKHAGAREYREAAKNMKPLADKIKATTLAYRADASRDGGLLKYTIAKRKAFNAYQLLSSKDIPVEYRDNTSPLLKETKLLAKRSGKFLTDTAEEYIPKVTKSVTDLANKGAAEARIIINNINIDGEVTTKTKLVEKLKADGTKHEMPDVVRQLIEGDKTKLTEKLKADGTRHMMPDVVKQLIDDDKAKQTPESLRQVLTKTTEEFKKSSSRIVLGTRDSLKVVETKLATKSQKLLEVQSTMVNAVQKVLTEAINASSVVLGIEPPTPKHNNRPPPSVPFGMYNRVGPQPPKGYNDIPTGYTADNKPDFGGQIGPVPGGYVYGQGANNDRAPTRTGMGGGNYTMSSPHAPSGTAKARNRKLQQSEQVHGRMLEAMVRKGKQKFADADMDVLEAGLKRNKKRRFNPEATLRSLRAIDAAAAYTGLPVRLLKNVCYAESNIDPLAYNPVSKATGLFQFLPKTWKESYGKWAKMLGFIGKDAYNPEANAMFGAMYIKHNKARTLVSKGSNILTEGESYTILFMGGGGSSSLARAVRKTPNRDATKKFPTPTFQNPSVFRIPDKKQLDQHKWKPRTCIQVKRELQRRMTIGERVRWLHAYYPPQAHEETYIDPEGLMGDNVSSLEEQVGPTMDAAAEQTTASDGYVGPRKQVAQLGPTVVNKTLKGGAEGAEPAQTTPTGGINPVQINTGMGGDSLALTSNMMDKAASTNGPADVLGSSMAQLVQYARETNQHLRSISANSDKPTQVEVKVDGGTPEVVKSGGTVNARTNIPFRTKNRNETVALGDQETFGAKTPTI